MKKAILSATVSMALLGGSYAKAATTVIGGATTLPVLDFDPGEPLPAGYVFTDAGDIWFSGALDLNTGNLIDPVTGNQIDPITGNIVDFATGNQIDPITGFVIDPTTGYVIDPVTGNLFDPVTGWIYDPVTGTLIDPANNNQVVDLDTYDYDETLLGLGEDKLSASALLKIEKQLPKGWSINPITGTIIPPPGEDLSLPFEVVTNVPAGLLLPALYDVDKGMAVAGSTKGGSVLYEINQSLIGTGCQVKQNSDGFLDVDCVLNGVNVKFTLMPDTAVQGPADAVPGVSVDVAGNYVLTTNKKRQFVMIGAPGDMRGIHAGLGDGGQASLTRDGVLKIIGVLDELLARARTERTRYVRADADTRQSSGSGTPPAQPTVTITSNTQGAIVYPNGTEQTIHATVPLPTVFMSEARKFPGVEHIVYQSNGTFKVIHQGKPYTLEPDFNIQTVPVTTRAPAPPQLTLNPDFTLTYIVQDGTNIVTVKLGIR